MKDIKSTLTKIIVLFSTVTVSLLWSNAYANSNLVNINLNEKIFTQKGYPYKDLVQRTELVKLHYNDAGESVNCSVEIISGSQVWFSPSLNISKRSFKKAPFASCIERSFAKKVLNSTH